MQSNTEAILEQFPTEKYKRFWYPTRPLFTLCWGLLIAGLGFIGILPLSWAVWFAAAFAFDDLPLTPITAMFTAVNNLMQGRKTLKAIVMITAISLAIIGGGLLGYFVLAQTPFAVKLIVDYISLSSCSPILISLGAMLGAYAAHATHKISPFMGFGLGIIVASWIPFSPPLIVEIVFLSAASCAFVTSMLTKQALRAYFKYAYGESNADGYEQARSPEEQDAFIVEQAKKFDVTPEEFQKLAAHCKEKASVYKSEASILEEFMGQRNYVTNSFKDIYHGLMNPRLTPAAAIITKNLIANSQLAAIDNTTETRATVDMHFAWGTFFREGVSARTLGHQIKIAQGGGLDAEMVRPFM